MLFDSPGQPRHPRLYSPKEPIPMQKGAMKTNAEEEKGISRCASALHGTSVCRSTSNFQAIQKVKVKLENQHPVLFLFVPRYPRSMFSIPQ
ncbi:hypothetical protein QQF64_015945 [Cirrhinus molitorella]|uniref:Uncharacterized protein n=1 Tax=Cirrhinus molitorella TaxID=172907 RepID=A0ABR3LLE9_9TELE